MNRPEHQISNLEWDGMWEEVLEYIEWLEKEKKKLEDALLMNEVVGGG